MGTRLEAYPVGSEVKKSLQLYGLHIHRMFMFTIIDGIDFESYPNF